MCVCITSCRFVPSKLGVFQRTLVRFSPSKPKTPESKGLGKSENKVEGKGESKVREGQAREKAEEEEEIYSKSESKSACVVQLWC